MADLEDLSFILDAARNMRGLRFDMRRIAAEHKAMALAQSAPVETIAQFMNDCATEYLKRLGWQADLWANNLLKQIVMALVTAMGGTQAQVVGKYQDLKEAAEDLRDASKTTYAEIITACDAILTTVPVGHSVWPNTQA